MKRNRTTEEKFAIVVEGLKERRSGAEICREHQISQNLYYCWRDKFLAVAKQGLVNGGGGNDRAYCQMIEKLQKFIGKQAIQIEILKKRTPGWRQSEVGEYVSASGLCGPVGYPISPSIKTATGKREFHNYFN
ncbi:MAG: transposase [bacterium]